MAVAPVDEGTPICDLLLDGALLVYDITDIESFNKVRKWVKELRKIVGSNISIVIAGNKGDLERQRAVSIEEATRCAAAASISTKRPHTLEDHWGCCEGNVTPTPRIMTWCLLLHESDHSYAETVGAPHFVTSAKQNKGLEECFLELTQSE
jgi:Ras-related protein Rab-21